MANEITVTAGLRVLNGNLSFNTNAGAQQADQTTARGGGPGTVTVGTTQESIAFGDISPGYVFMQNLDDTNFVKFGTVTGDLGGKLSPGMTAVFEMVSGETLYVIADTADCDVLVVAANT